MARENIRLAATVLLIRDSHDGVEVFMVQRPGRGDFPNLHVFPGGKVDETDFLPELCDGLDDDNASSLMGVSGGGLRYWVAAIRECFEECGVLLAHRDGVDLRIEGEDAHRFADLRRQLHAGDLDIASVCASERLTLSCRDMHYFSHWLTPIGVPRRFDTRFFVASMPAGQNPDPHEWEVEDGLWITAKQALANHEREQWQMISPTVVTLQTIAAFDDCQSLITAVDAEQHNPEYTSALSVQGMQPMR